MTKATQRKKVFIHCCGSRGKIHSGREGMTARRQGRKFRDVPLQAKSERANWKECETINSHNWSPVALSSAWLYLLLSCHHIEDPCAQILKPMGNIFSLKLPQYITFSCSCLAYAVFYISACFCFDITKDPLSWLMHPLIILWANIISSWRKKHSNYTEIRVRKIGSNEKFAKSLCVFFSLQFFLMNFSSHIHIEWVCHVKRPSSWIQSSCSVVYFPHDKIWFTNWTQGLKSWAVKHSCLILCRCQILLLLKQVTELSGENTFKNNCNICSCLCLCVFVCA